MAPRKAYFEFDAQPAIMTPYTPIDVSARIYKRLASIFASTSVSVKGSTAQAASAGAIDNIGATTNRKRLELVGTIISFVNNFSASAIGCSQPRGPTRFGPIRTCM